MTATTILRGIFFVGGALLALSGLAALAADREAAFAGLWLVLAGGFFMIVAVIERGRYRSAAAERTNDPAGPGGGETLGQIDPRFRPTDELFVDPSTGIRMRVLLDPRTGERRYVAEG